MKRIVLVAVTVFLLILDHFNAYATIETHEGHSADTSNLKGQVITATDDKFSIGTSYFDGTLASTVWVKNKIYLQLRDDKMLLQSTKADGTTTFNVQLKIQVF